MSAELPAISIVTASLNRANYLEQAMRSVLDQNYPKLEYVVVDGGSTDASAEIIRKYQDRLHWWCSEKDGGFADALNKGFARTSGEVMAFLNSDDMYCPWAFSVVAEVFQAFPQIEWLTTLFPLHWDKDGRATRCRYVEGFSRAGFLRGENLPPTGTTTSTYWIQQESTFWRRSLWEKTGGRIDQAAGMALDFELWARFFGHAELYGVSTPLAGFRLHGDQLSGHLDKYRALCRDILARHGGRPRGAVASALRGSALDRVIPARLKYAWGLRHPRKQVTYNVLEGRWMLRSV